MTGGFCRGRIEGKGEYGMTIYENLATETIVSIFKTSAYWKKEIVFNFLLRPFDKNIDDVSDVTSQETLKNTKPDFTIHLNDEKTKIHFEVKINNDGLTEYEKKEGTRDAFLVKSDYYYTEYITNKLIMPILTWEDFFDEIDKKEAMPHFEELRLLRNCLFGTNKNLDMEFLTQFLYSKESVKEELRGIFNELFNLIKKENVKLEDDITSTYYGLYLSQNNQSISLGYEFGDDYKVGHFNVYLNEDKKQLQMKEATEFLKLYDKVWYFYKHIKPFIKNKRPPLIKNETEILDAFLEKASELSPKSYLQICQTILERQLYPALEEYANKHKLIMEYDDISDCGDEYWPKIYFHKKAWNEKFYIAFQFDLTKNFFTDSFPPERYPEFYYGIWTWNWLSEEDNDCYKKLKKIKIDNFNNPQNNNNFPLIKKTGKRINPEFFKNKEIKNLCVEMENVIKEILKALKKKKF